jgi:hypothetical protein
LDTLSLRKMIEGRVIVVGETTYELRLVDVKAHSDWGTTLHVGITGTDRMQSVTTSGVLRELLQA